MRSILFACAVVFCLASVNADPRTATCRVEPNPSGTDQNVIGNVTFTQASATDEIVISVELEGFATGDAQPSLLHGFHVHQYGDIVTDGCASTGGHYNPFNKNHGGPTDTERHPGDFGNLVQDDNGVIITKFTDPMATLYGATSIVGRAIVVHGGEDDLGKGGNKDSLANGNAGPRLACCVIGIANPE